MGRQRTAIVFDGRKWYVRRIRVIEHDLSRGEIVYRCDKPLSNDHKRLRDVPQVARAMELAVTVSAPRLLNAEDM